MANLKDDAKKQSVAKAEKSAEEKELDRSANELAQQASKTEQEYDEDHDIFTK